MKYSLILKHIIYTEILTLTFYHVCLILYFQVHIKQQDATGELSEDVKAALLQYNSIVSLSSSVRCMVQFAVCSLSVSLPLRALQ